MNATRTDSPVIQLGASRPDIQEFGAPKPKPKDGWPLSLWILFIALIFVAHVAAIFVFGEHHFPPARVAKNVPQLQLADNSSELVALGDPTLFALPHARDFALLKMPEISPPEFRWTEPPRWLPLNSKNLGVAFTQFMQTNSFGIYQINFKPPLKWNPPATTFQPAFTENSTLQIRGELARRKLLNPVLLPDWPYADVIAPSKVQALVDADGDVISAVLLPLDNSPKLESRYPTADHRALEIARAARFSPASGLTIGVMIFHWRSVPPAANSTANPVP